MGSSTKRAKDDEEQIEYLKRWRKEKEAKRQRKIEKRSIRNMHIRFMGLYIRAAVGRVIIWLKKLKK